MKNLILMIAEELGNKKFLNVSDVIEIMRDNMTPTKCASEKIWEVKEKKYKYEEVCEEIEKGNISYNVLNKDIISKQDLLEFAGWILAEISKNSGLLL